MLCEMLQGVDHERDWNLDLMRDLDIPEINMATNLLGEIENPNEVLGDISNEDERVWTENLTGNFSVKSYYEAIMDEKERMTTRNTPLVQFSVKYVWNKVILTKISILAWAAFHESLSTKDVLKRRGMLFGINWVNLNSAALFLNLWKMKFALTRMTFLRFCLPFAIWRAIWEERNEIVFNGVDKVLEKPIITVKDILFS
ncbi:Reverse transcriptase zinc-binding domain [Macleaya cordata]|uniref:Reverse transcriptase zinc-binding domain n=1 Tax=Macleaya cordata TaxID=56857 RepID=A0A200QAK3_MACCD|nr:Reverse transcriptase zinc-binding domain [Macleaya cordata]